MAVDLSSVSLRVSKPDGRVARRLAKMGIRIVSIANDLGNVDQFVISRRLVVERRTGSGFLQGIMDKTLFANAILLRRHFRMPVLVLEGAINYKYTSFDPQAVRGALSSMITQYSMNVLQTTDTDETAELIAMMARQEQLGVAQISLVPKRPASSLDDMQRRVVEMFPGCGRVTARNLLQHFGSVERIVRATELELRAVPGIGARTSRSILEVLSAEYLSIDTEKQLEDAIESDPALLFDHPVRLIGRQHLIINDQARHVIDLIFHDPAADEVILVELKHARLQPSDREQLRRYLDCARKSQIVRRHVDCGSGLRGVLVSTEQGNLAVRYPDISVKVVNRHRAIMVLSKLRRMRLDNIPAEARGG
jgi:ERCC4-type nuclease